jgi:hypothetical protein
MKKVLILGGGVTEYGAAKGQLSTPNTATDITLLASGSLAIYGFVDAGGGNINSAVVGKDTLITNGTNSASLVAAADFAARGNSTITISQGGKTTPVQVYAINRRGITRVTKQAYVAPVKQVSFIGFNGVTNGTNMPTITQGSEATLLAVQQEASAADQIRNQEDYGVGNIEASANEYTVLSRVVNEVNKALDKTHTAFVVGNGTFGATTTNTGTLTLTNGSKVLSFATALPAGGGWTAAVNQYISIANTPEGNLANAPASAINGTVYRIVSISGTTLTLDREYQGSSGTISQANVQAGHIALLTATTSWGIKLISDFTDRVYNYAVQGLLQNTPVTAYYVGDTTNTQVQAPSKGLGTGDAVAAIENGLIAYRGQFDTVDKRMKQLPKYADTSLNYTSYNIQFTMSTQVTGAPHNRSENSSITIFIPTTQTNVITAFEAIIKELAPVTQALYNF